MENIKIQRRLLPLAQRGAAEHYLALTLFSFAASVTLTRVFLSLTGYPQIGGGELHIAHVLWGGLLLYAAALLPLILAGRRVYTLGALLAGTGVGLFIDEVGKFITQKNDYFYPIAASIIYLLFLFTLLLFLHLRRTQQVRPGALLRQACEELGETLGRPLTRGEYARLHSTLARAADSAISQSQVDLARALAKYLEQENCMAASGEERQGVMVPDNRWAARPLSERWLRVGLIVGLVGIGLLSLKNPLSVGLASWLPPAPAALLHMSVGRHVEAAVAPLLANVRMGVETIVGLLLLSSAALLGTRRDRLGTTVGGAGLFLSLTAMNVLLFYFEQFSTVFTAAIQFLLIAGLLVYRRRADPLSR